MTVCPSRCRCPAWSLSSAWRRADSCPAQQSTSASSPSLRCRSSSLIGSAASPCFPAAICRKRTAYRWRHAHPNLQHCHAFQQLGSGSALHTDGGARNWMPCFHCKLRAVYAAALEKPRGFLVLCTPLIENIPCTLGAAAREGGAAHKGRSSAAREAACAAERAREQRRTRGDRQRGNAGGGPGAAPAPPAAPHGALHWTSIAWLVPAWRTLSLPLSA